MIAVTSLKFRARIRIWSLIAGTFVLAVVATPQEEWQAGLSDPEARVRARAVRSLGESEEGFRHLGLLAPLLDDESEQVRWEIVKVLIHLRTLDAQDLLIRATSDLSPRVQALAVDGLVDFYVPRYIRPGSFLNVGSRTTALKQRFVKPTPLTVSSYVEVSPATVAAIGTVVRSGRSEEARASAARGIGVLLGRDALDDLLEGVKSRDSTVILECVLAIRKLQEPSAGPAIVFLLEDPDPRIREAVVRAVGQLRTKEAVPGLVEMIQGRCEPQLCEQAMIALAKIPDNGQRELFLGYMVHKQKGLRAAAAEGVARVRDPTDARLIEHHFQMERAAGVKLSLAFAAVSLGNYVRLNQLVDGLKSKAYRLVARPFLVELARHEEVRKRLYVPLSTGTNQQRIHLAYVLSHSGDEGSIPHLEELTADSSAEVASAAIEALRVLRARL